MSVYLTVCGVIVAIQVFCVIVTTAIFTAAVRRERKQVGDDTMNMLRGWTDEDEEWLRRLKGGGNG